MNTKELRIKNLVSVENRAGGQSPTEILSIRPSGVTCHNYNLEENSQLLYEIDCDCEEINPIPLTEEWLLKFGFLRDGAYYSHQNLNILAARAKIGGGEVFVMPNNKFANELKYVHQLQNLYFVLTGEELKTAEEYE